MAIKLNVDLQNGIVVKGAYCRIESIKCDKVKMEFVLRKYTDKEKPSFSETTFVSFYDINGENCFKQAYEYLKTLEDFKDSEVC